MEKHGHKRLRLDAMESNSVQNNITKITSGLYIGGRDCVDDLTVLKNLSITHIVNCTMDIPDYFKDDMEYLDVPLTDDPEYAIEDHFDRVFSFIDTAREEGNTCLVHCSQGMSRSATFVIAYLVQSQGMSLLEALRYTRTLRPVVSPNVGFMRKLWALELRTRQKASLDHAKYRKDRFASIDELVVDVGPSPAD